MPGTEVIAAPSSGANFSLARSRAEGNGEADAASASDQLAQLSINDEVYTKHPLQNTWTLWFFKNDRNKDWEENQKAVINFSTVEDFWALYNHIEEAGKLAAGCDYSLFKKGVKPMWEDKHNKSGGRWLINLKSSQRDPELTKFWTEVMLLMIGEAFGEEHGKYVCGAVVSVRAKGDKIGLWLGSAQNSDAVMAIGRKTKQCLGLRHDKIYFETHVDSSAKTSSRPRSLYSL